jgi:hypothetical protein
MKEFLSADNSNMIGAEQITPSNGGSRWNGRAGTGCSKGFCEDCAGILHDLNNALASMLLNAQVMEWKMPSYSRSKRYLHEIERNAQRGGELVKRLLARLEAGCLTRLTDRPACGEAHDVSLAEGAAASPELGITVQAPEPPQPATHADPVFLSTRRKLPHTMV